MGSQSRAVPFYPNKRAVQTGSTQSRRIQKNYRKSVENPKVATLAEKLGSGVSVNLYMIVGSVSYLHTNYMVNHNSQECREHKKIHTLLHLAEGVGFGDNYNKPECSILHVILHVTSHGVAVVILELKFKVFGVGPNQSKVQTASTTSTNRRCSIIADDDNNKVRSNECNDGNNKGC